MTLRKSNDISALGSNLCVCAGRIGVCNVLPNDLRNGNPAMAVVIREATPTHFNSDHPPTQIMSRFSKDDPFKSPLTSPDKRTVELSAPPSEQCGSPSKRQRSQLEQESPTKYGGSSVNISSLHTPIKPTGTPLPTPRTTSRCNLDPTTAAGIVRRSINLGNIISLIEFFLRSFLGETSLPTAEEVGAVLTQYWQENVTVLLVS